MNLLIGCGYSSDEPALSRCIRLCRYNCAIIGAGLLLAEAWGILNDCRWIGDGQWELAWIREEEMVKGDIEGSMRENCWYMRGFVHDGPLVCALVAGSRALPWE